jgi:hypothetical protein
MKRISEDEVPDTMEILNILQKAHCKDDLEKKNPNEIQELYNKYLDVQASNPKWFIDVTYDMEIDSIGQFKNWMMNITG